MNNGVRLVMAILLLDWPGTAQWLDPGSSLAEELSRDSGKKLALTGEFRSRFETRSGVNFGKSVDIDTGLLRTRLGLSLTPVPWLKFSGMLQDSRAPWYGPNAPNTVRDSVDLHEAYFELFGNRQDGFGMTAGRAMLNYGEGRLLGTPQWGNLARTYDNARVYYRFAKARLEFLLVSPVKIRSDEFNRPVLGDRVWGSYNSFPDVFRKTLLEAYLLRHEQSRLSVDTYGFRAAGPLALKARYSLEGAYQTGWVGAAQHRAGAWFSGLSRRWSVAGRALDVSGEYKFASGTADPGNPNRTHTFDQLYPANHDKFGHQDLFGWRNIHNLRGLITLAVSKPLGVNVMYDNYWLASARDALYNGNGNPIAKSAGGAAGRHVGSEVDLFATYKYLHYTFGAGYGYFFKGAFVRNTTPGVNSNYLYVFQSYSF